MRELSDNVYDILQYGNVHSKLAADLGETTQYSVVGGLSTHAILHAEHIDWDNGIVAIDGATSLSRLRNNGTVRDIDMLVHTSADAAIINSREILEEVVDGAVVASVFGLRHYADNRYGLTDVVGRRYITDDGHLYWRASGIETPLPSESLLPWSVRRDGQTVCTILNPVAQLGAYKNRSIAGERPKDQDKISRLQRLVMPNGKIADIPGAYRPQYMAFLEQAEKMAQARRRVGFFAMKAGLVSVLESRDWAVRLGQGGLETVLGSLAGKR